MIIVSNRSDDLKRTKRKTLARTRLTQSITIRIAEIARPTQQETTTCPAILTSCVFTYSIYAMVSYDSLARRHRTCGSRRLLRSR